MTPRITHSAWPAHQDAIHQLRRAVFIIEQQVPEALEWDDLDVFARHFCLWQQNRLVAYARLLFLTEPQAVFNPPHGLTPVQAYGAPDGLAGGSGKLTRMAVCKSARGQGLGRLLLCDLIAWARQAGLCQLSLDAQLQAEGFYQREGFVACGEVFWDAGIEHRHMTLSLIR